MILAAGNRAPMVNSEGSGPGDIRSVVRVGSGRCGIKVPSGSRLQMCVSVLVVL